MIINGKKLLEAAPLVGMLDHKARAHGVSHGLAEVGYDIRIKQDIFFGHDVVRVSSFDDRGGRVRETRDGNFTLASAIEEFQMPPNLVGIVHDKSSWARKGLSVFNTVIEPGWHGFLTLELVYHGREDLVIPAGAGIAQVIFHQIAIPTNYSGHYQGQPDRPVESIIGRKED